MGEVAGGTELHALILVIVLVSGGAVGGALGIGVSVFEEEEGEGRVGAAGNTVPSAGVSDQS